MKTINKKIATILTTTAIFSFTLTGCASHSATSNKQTTANKQITVSYTLKEGKKTLDSKKIKLPKKNPKVMNGLQKGWKVKQTKGSSSVLMVRVKILRRKSTGPTLLTASGLKKAQLSKTLKTMTKLSSL